LTPPFRVLEVFAGGGTMTAALTGNAGFQVVAGVEIEPDFADEWQAQHPQATLVQSDIRALHTSELPEFDVLIGGIPCTCHSNLGRAKKRLAGKPELGDTGDLFLPVVTLVSEQMPAAVVFENVPAFGSSLAGKLLVSHLRRLGYHVTVESGGVVHRLFGGDFPAAPPESVNNSGCCRWPCWRVGGTWPY
jgi:DNA (cytosine-5)-methyltransferase 1